MTGLKARRTRGDRGDRRARHRQDPPPVRAGGAADEQRLHRALRKRLRVRAGPAVLGVRGRARRVRGGPRSAPAGAARGRRARRARAGAPLAVRVRRRERSRAPGPALPRPSRGRRAAPAPGGDEAARARARRRPLGRLRLDRPARRASAPPAGSLRAARHRRAAEADAGAAGGRARARGPRGRADTARAGPRSSATRPASCSASSATAALADELYRQSGGNPFYLEQLARSPDRGARRAGDRHGIDAHGRRGAARGGRRADRGARAALGADARACSRAPRSRATPSSPSWRPPRPRSTSGGHRRRSTSCSRATSSGRPTCRAASASATRWCARSSTRPRPAAGGSARTSAAPARSRSAAHPPAARAHHVEHAAAPGTRTPGSRSCGRPGSRRWLRAPASAARWFGAALRLLPDSAPPEERGALLMARAEALAATGQLELRPRGPARDARAGAGRRRRAAGAADRRLRQRRAPARPPRAGARAPGAGALDDLPDPAAPEAVALMVELAIDGLFRAEYEAMREWAERALEAARAARRRAAHRDRRLGVLALACSFTGAIDDAERHRARGAELVDAMRDDELAGRIEARRPHRRSRALPRPLSRGGGARRARARDRRARSASCSPR